MLFRSISYLIIGDLYINYQKEKTPKWHHKSKKVEKRECIEQIHSICQCACVLITPGGLQKVASSSNILLICSYQPFQPTPYRGFYHGLKSPMCYHNRQALTNGMFLLITVTSVSRIQFTKMSYSRTSAKGPLPCVSAMSHSAMCDLHKQEIYTLRLMVACILWPLWSSTDPLISSNFLLETYLFKTGVHV